MLALLIIAVTSAWAQDEVTVAPTANANEWTLEMPDADVELEVEYYTDEELAAEEEAAFTAGVELTKASNGEWTLAEMPGFDIELEMEYYTELKDDETIDYSAIGSTADTWLSRTLKTGSWNTFASPVAIDTDQLTALGITAVKQLGSSSFSEGVLTLNFTDAATIEAGKPYLVKVSADKEIGAFDGATVSGTTTATETTAADFIPTLGATTITGDPKKILFLTTGNKLRHPSELPSNMKGFRAYFLLKGEAAQASSISLNLNDGEATGIQTIDNGQLIMRFMTCRAAA